MANTCFTDITINGNINEINSLWRHLNEALPEQSDGWIGNLIKYIGKPTEGVSCRGTVTYTSKMGNESICISQEDAWEPHLAPIVLFCEKYAPRVEILYEAEEGGCGLYLTNNNDMAGKWIVYADHGPLEDIDSPITTSELMYKLNSLFGNDDNLEKLIEKAEDEYGACIEQWDFCDICDVC